MRYHLIGIGGIGMSALARILLQRGQSVRGSDIKPSPLLEQLVAEGAQIQIGHSADWVEKESLVVFNTDISEDNPELLQAKQWGLKLLHRSDLLALLMEKRQVLLATGTHGKTTTTALLAAVFLEAKRDPSFVVGGILQQLKTNGQDGKGPFFIAEADESDGSFLKTPYLGAIVTNLEKEHLNYWKSQERLEEGFRQFFTLSQRPEHLFWCKDDPGLARLSPPGLCYGFDKASDCRIENFSQSEAGISYDLVFRGKRLERLEVALFGRHNACNSAAVIALALSLDLPEEAIRRALKAFGGTRRRLEHIGRAKGIDVYDDYGHHPTEIEVTLAALKERARERRLVVLFQPHRYTRVRDLFERFIDCFGSADKIFMTDIFAAGEQPLAGVSSRELFERLKQRWKERMEFFPRAKLEEESAKRLLGGDVVLTLGAGDITAAGKKLLELL